MDHLSARQLRLLDLSGWLYGVAFYTTYRRFLGLSLSVWLHLLLLAVALAVLLLDWGIAVAFLFLALFLLLRLVYWWVRRRGYKSFVPDPTAVLPPDVQPLRDGIHLALRATGVFAVTRREAYLLDRSPSEYWHTPLGDHIMMVQQSVRPARFLYQFYNEETLTAVEPGYLIAAGRTRPALAVTFGVTWGPEFVDDTLWYYIGAGKNRPRDLKQRTIYFTFAKDEDRLRLWKTISLDVKGDA